jgi:hypothetical protein
MVFRNLSTAIFTPDIARSICFVAVWRSAGRKGKRAIRRVPRGFTVKSLRRTLMLLSALCMVLPFAVASPVAQNAAQPVASAPQPKYRTHFLIYDVQQKTAKTIFTVEGEWHAPNWTPDEKYSTPSQRISVERRCAA